MTTKKNSIITHLEKALSRLSPGITGLTIVGNGKADHTSPRAKYRTPITVSVNIHRGSDIERDEVYHDPSIASHWIRNHRSYRSLDELGNTHVIAHLRSAWIMAFREYLVQDTLSFPVPLAYMEIGVKDGRVTVVKGYDRSPNREVKGKPLAILPARISDMGNKDIREALTPFVDSIQKDMVHYCNRMQLVNSCVPVDGHSYHEGILMLSPDMEFLLPVVIPPYRNVSEKHRVKAILAKELRNRQ